MFLSPHCFQVVCFILLSRPVIGSSVKKKKKKTANTHTKKMPSATVSRLKYICCQSLPPNETKHQALDAVFH